MRSDCSYSVREAQRKKAAEARRKQVADCGIPVGDRLQKRLQPQPLTPWEETLFPPRCPVSCSLTCHHRPRFRGIVPETIREVLIEQKLSDEFRFFQSLTLELSFRRHLSDSCSHSLRRTRKAFVSTRANCQVSNGLEQERRLARFRGIEEFYLNRQSTANGRTTSESRISDSRPPCKRRNVILARLTWANLKPAAFFAAKGCPVRLGAQLPRKTETGPMISSTTGDRLNAMQMATRYSLCDQNICWRQLLATCWAVSDSIP